MKKYDLSGIMKAAWGIFRKCLLNMTILVSVNATAHMSEDEFDDLTTF